MPEGIGGYGGDKDGSGSRSYYAAPYPAPAQRRSHGAAIVIAIGALMALLSLWALMNDGGEIALSCVFIGLAVTVIGLCEKFLPKDKPDFPL